MVLTREASVSFPQASVFSYVKGSDRSGEKSAIHIFKLCFAQTFLQSTSSWNHSSQAILLDLNRAETGVGPSIADGSHGCRLNGQVFQL